MIDSVTLLKAKNLKKSADAAYVVFKKSPTSENASGWTAATRAYNDFCVSTITGLIEEPVVDKTTDIINHIESYKKCKQCNAELLYSTSDDSFIASSDFVEDFPGWCYNCLVEHCMNQECVDCKVASDPGKCPFYRIKLIHQQNR